MTLSFYLGFWINWSRGRILGATLTIAPRYSSILIAFLAIFVTWTSSRLWSIICFILHQTRATTEERDGTHWQLQTVFSSGLSPLGMLRQIYTIGWRWRKRTAKIPSRFLPLVFVCTTYFIAFAVAGLFSSRIAVASDEVLLLTDSLPCGWVDKSLATSTSRMKNLSDHEIDSIDALMIVSQLHFDRSREYWRSCYSKLASYTAEIPSGDCQFFVSGTLKSRTNLTTECPFASGACMTEAVLFDSGWVDSREHLGINYPDNGRIQFRRVTSCAPIPAEERYSDGWTINPQDPNDQVKSYYLGPKLNSIDDGFGNATMTVERKSWNASIPYSPKAFTRYVGNLSDSWFEPIPDLAREDADVSVILFLNNVAYPREIKDVLFQAPQLQAMLFPGETELWTPNSTVSALGCTEQYQFCGNEYCTDVGGYYQTASAALSKLQLTEDQRAISHAILNALWAARMFWMFYTPHGDETLLAADQIFGASNRIINAADFMNPTPALHFSTTLDDNQWQQEAEHIHELSLALIQNAIFEHAAPVPALVRPGVPATDFAILASSDAERKVCRQQKVRSPSQMSFSVLGLAAIIFGGLSIIALSYGIPAVVLRYQLDRPQFAYRSRQWNLSSVIQLLRIAFEKSGTGPWLDEGDNVPVTRNYGQEFKWEVLSQEDDYLEKPNNAETATLVGVDSEQSERRSESRFSH